MTRAVCLAAALGAACILPPFEVAGKACTTTCIDGFSCQGERCVPDGRHFCDVVDAGACLDFETAVTFDGGLGWQQQEIGDTAFRVAAGAGMPGAGLVSESSDGGNGAQGRLTFPLPPWQHVRLSFDFKPVALTVPPTQGYVAIAEIQCQSFFNGVWLHFRSNQGFALVQGPANDGETVLVLSPQLPLGQWHRITLETVAGVPNIGALSIDGQDAGALTFEPCPTGWEANLGLVDLMSQGFQSAQFDNVVLEIAPP